MFRVGGTLVGSEKLRYFEFPRSLEERLNAILESVNTEVKQATLLLMTDYPQTGNDLCSEFRLVTNNAWLITRRSFSAYCESIFVPYGLVIEDRVTFDNGSSSKAWRNSKANIKYGKPASSYAHKLVSRYDISMFSLLGTAQSGGERTAPLTRFSILESLLRYGTATRKDLAEYSSSLEGNMLQHLKQLMNIGIVKYDSIDTVGELWARYTWVKGRPSDVQPLRRYERITSHVADLLFKIGSAHRNTIAEELRKMHEYKDRSVDVIRDKVSIVLAALDRLGFAKVNFRSNETKSIAQLTDFGRDVATDVMIFKDYAMGKCSTFYEDWMDYTIFAITKYREVSPYKRSEVFSQRCEKVYEIIRRNSSINRNDIQIELGANPSNFLLYLIKNGKIVKKKIGRKVFYSIIEN